MAQLQTYTKISTEAANQSKVTVAKREDPGNRNQVSGKTQQAGNYYRLTSQGVKKRPG